MHPVVDRHDCDVEISVTAKPVFTAPEESDYGWLADHWVRAQSLIKDEWGYELNQSLDDLHYLQRVIDQELIDFGAEFARECIGVAFGRVVATNIPGLDWWIVQDEFGRALTMRYGETTLRYNVINMISKRLAENTKPNLQSSFASIAKHNDEMKDRVD